MKKKLTAFCKCAGMTLWIFILALTGCSNQNQPNSSATPGTTAGATATSQAVLPTEGPKVEMKQAILSTLGIGEGDITGYWGFDEEEGSFADLSGNGNAAPMADRALGFNNRGGALSLTREQRLEIKEQTELFGYEQFTINFFLTFDKFTPAQFNIISKDCGGKSSFRLLVSGMADFVVNTSQVSWYGTGSVNKLGEDIDYAAMVGDWAMMTITYDGSSLVMYLNGEQVGKQSLKGTLVNDKLSPFTIGSNPNNNTISGFDGRMDELLVLKTGLGEEKVQALYERYVADFGYVSPSQGSQAGSQSLKGEVITQQYLDFQQPAAAYRMAQYLMGQSINVNLLQRKGIGTAVLGLSGSNYLNNENDWNKLKRDVERCLNAGIGVWLFDEKGFPSGGAGGNTITDATAQYEVRGVQALTQSVSKGKTVTISLPQGGEKFISAMAYPRKSGKADFTNGKSVTVSDTAVTYTASEDCIVYAFMQKVLLENTGAWYNCKTSWSNGGRYPNFLSKGAGDLFVNNTYKQFTAHLGQELMDQVTAIYTNEPSLMTGFADSTQERTGKESYIPWTEELPAKFKARHGYDLMPYLGMLFDRADTSKEAKYVRTAFYQTVADLYDEAFSQNIEDYCTSVGTQLTGHFLMEEYISAGVMNYGNFMQTIGSLGMPGNDLYIGRTGMERAVDFVTLKYTSSAAHNVGKYNVQTLLDPILGGYYESSNNKFYVIPTEVWKENISLAFLLGSNHMTTYNTLQYSDEVYTEINNYAGRLATILRGAVDQAQVAVYYPIEDMQAKYVASYKQVIADTEYYKKEQEEQNEIASALIAGGIDFNFVDSATLETSSIGSGTLDVGKYGYRAVVVPSVEVLPLETMKKLKAFEQAGGKVFWCGDLPDTDLNAAETSQLAANTPKGEKVSTPSSLPAKLQAVVKKIMSVSATNPQYILQAAYAKDIEGDGTTENIVMIQNLSARGEKITISAENYSGRLRVFFPEEGVVVEADNGSEMTIAPHSAVLVTFAP